MLKNKVFLVFIAILIAITLILVSAFILWQMLDKTSNSLDPNDQAAESVQSVKAKQLSASELKDMTVEMKDILTNLSTRDFIKMSFTFELDSKKAKNEFELLDYKVKAIIIQTMADLTPEDVQGSKGYDNLTSLLMNKINPILQQGKLKQIWITDKVLQ